MCGPYVLLSVYEFRNTRCSRIFTSWISPQFALNCPWTEINAQKADAHGTYNLLEGRIAIGSGVQVSCITFNTMSKTFGNLRFQAPLSDENGSCLIWNEHMVFQHRHSKVSVLRPCILSVAERRSPDHPSLETVPDAVKYVMEGMMMSANSAEISEHSLGFITRSPPTRIEASEGVKPRYDIARLPDVPRRYSLMPEINAAAGLRSIMSFYGGQCSWEGIHDRDCPRSSGPSVPERYLYPVNYFACNALHTTDVWVKASHADDDFLVIFTNLDFCTVFAVDEDGKIADAMRDGVSESVENVSEGPKSPDIRISVS